MPWCNLLLCQLNNHDPVLHGLFTSAGIPEVVQAAPALGSSSSRTSQQSNRYQQQQQPGRRACTQCNAL
jgi:hypothetical protein